MDHFSRRPFIVKERQCPAQYMRHYRRGVADHHRPTTLAVKQLIPVSNQTPKDGDVTIIFAGGIGCAKELYEPLFEDLVTVSAANGFRIRSIWVADPATSCQSAILNEDNMGNQPSWWDHSRDLLFMINTFRDLMPQPLVGLGHSLGAAQLAYLSILHPSLLSSLALIEPAIYPVLGSPDLELLCRSTVRRREEWPTRAEAEAAISRNPAYKGWDARVLAALKKYGLMETAAGTVRTTSSKHQEIALIFMPNFHHVGKDGPEAMTAEQREAFPDIYLADGLIWYPVWRPEPIVIMKLLPNVRPSVLYVVGSASGSSLPEVREVRLATTGIGQGGSGGRKLGRVKQVIIDRGQHMIAFDRHMGEVARAVGLWLGSEMKRWREHETALQREWKAKSVEERSSVDPVLMASFAEWTPGKDLVPIIQSKL